MINILFALLAVIGYTVIAILHFHIQYYFMTNTKKDDIILSLLKSEDENDHNLVCKMFSFNDVINVVKDYINDTNNTSKDKYHMLGITTLVVRWNGLGDNYNRFVVYRYKIHQHNNYTQQEVFDFILDSIIEQYNVINNE